MSDQYVIYPRIKDGNYDLIAYRQSMRRVNQLATSACLATSVFPLVAFMILVQVLDPRVAPAFTTIFLYIAICSHVANVLLFVLACREGSKVSTKIHEQMFGNILLCFSLPYIGVVAPFRLSRLARKAIDDSYKLTPILSNARDFPSEMFATEIRDVER